MHGSSSRRSPKWWGAFLCLAGLLTWGGEADAKKMRPVYPSSQSSEIDARTTIAVLAPKVAYSSFADATKRVDHEPSEVATWLQQLTLDALHARGFEVASEAPTETGPSARVRSLAEQYVRSRPGPEATSELLLEIGAQPRPDAVLVLYLEVELTARGHWNSWTGALGVGMSNSDLRGVLLERESGDVLWRGELYYRDVPEIGSKRWRTAVTDLYSTLIREED